MPPRAGHRQARARLTDLAKQFTAKRILRTPVWREVFERTWRHPYVPGYYPDKDAPYVLSFDPAQRSRWLDAVYSDTTASLDLSTNVILTEATFFGGHARGQHLT